MASHAFPRTAHWPNSLPSSFLLIPQACLLGQVPRQQGFISASRIFSFVASKGKLLNLSVVQGQFFCRSIFFFLRSFVFLILGGCAGSSLLCSGFLQLWRAGTTLWLWYMGFSWWLLLFRWVGFSSCGIPVQLPCGMWHLPGPGVKPISPSLTGRVLTIGSPGKCDQYFGKTTF